MRAVRKLAAVATGSLRNAPAGLIPTRRREPTVVWSDIDDRQTELSLEQAGWWIDALTPDSDEEAVGLLEPLLPS